MPEAIIRRFSAIDRKRWNALWQDYNIFYERSVEDRVTERLWSRLLENSGEPYGFAAELDGVVVGFAHYFFVFSTSDWNPRCYLQDLYAEPAARGRGVGRALIEAVYAEADRKEAAQTYWLTQEFNHTARRLYDRVGKLTPFVKYQR
ncbi:GNAT family N-acetyltransferase [Chelativorans salis]|uniref:GNAT family N-acetyltransferase n=1 Tax=Chelativorans salis TaxID=2978478 RepID=A0ABT2LRT3_9HYPH|nr:GNAT family N-acetyltransferase [Chelativorans sp. EGI FJ00035]MCT7377257.1 GNAT family N-acetyltransferase [Chelativorans sp. EGI FJ00035]